MDLTTFLGGITVGVVVTLFTDFLRPWIHRLNRWLEYWLDARGYDREMRSALEEGTDSPSGDA